MVTFSFKSAIQDASQKTPKKQYLTNHEKMTQRSPKLLQKSIKHGIPGVSKKSPETNMQETVPTSIITIIYNTLAMFAMLKHLEF